MCPRVEECCGATQRRLSEGSLGEESSLELSRCLYTGLFDATHTLISSTFLPKARIS